MNTIDVDPSLTCLLFSTVPSVAPANVSGGNGRRHELVISWEVSRQLLNFCPGKHRCP